jgi:hypothetical protein
MSVMTVGSHALPALHTKGAHWWASIVRYFTADSAVVTADTGDRVIPRRYPPKSYEYLENSAMRRAMERL